MSAEYKLFEGGKSLSDLKGMPSLTSITARFSLSAWFKRPNTMDPNPWNLLLERTLSQSTSITLHLYTSAAEKVSNPDSLLDRLDVVWMWQLKQDVAPFHEICIVETKDSTQRNEIRRFVLERVYQADGRIVPTEVTEIGLGNNEEPLTSISLPPVSIPSPQLSVGDSASLSAVQASHKVSESLQKKNHPDALDRFLGESFVDRYAYWQCVRQIKPRGLTFFHLVLLAHVVHMEAPTYTPLKDNCYWYVTTVFDAIVTHFGVDPSTTPEDTRRESRYSFDPDMPGRWRGLKITTSNPNEISVIVSKYKKAHTHQISKINAPSRLLVAAQQYSETVPY